MGGGMGMGGMGMMNPCAMQGCVQCPPGTHDAGTCQPNMQACGYNGVIGEMMESMDHCGGSSQGNPMLGGGMGGGMGMGGMGMSMPCAMQGCVQCPPGTHDAGTCQ